MTAVRIRDREPLPAITAVAGKKSLALRFLQGWLEGHALTSADLRQEAAYLKPLGFKLELE